MLDLDDQLAVIRGLVAGQREAWATLYDAYSGDVWSYAARLLGRDSALVADVVQEAFLEAARSAQRFDSARGTLWSWLVGIAHHKVLAHWRATQRADRLRQKLQGDSRALIDALRDGAADQIVQVHEVVELVRCALSELPPDYAALLTAKYIDEKSMDDLSRSWGESVEATKSKLARARRQFRAMFQQLNPNNVSVTDAIPIVDAAGSTGASRPLQ